VYPHKLKGLWSTKQAQIPFWARTGHTAHCSCLLTAAPHCPVYEPVVMYCTVLYCTVLYMLPVLYCIVALLASCLLSSQLSLKDNTLGYCSSVPFLTLLLGWNDHVLWSGLRGSPRLKPP